MQPTKWPKAVPMSGEMDKGLLYRLLDILICIIKDFRLFMQGPTQRKQTESYIAGIRIMRGSIPRSGLNPIFGAGHLAKPAEAT